MLHANWPSQTWRAALALSHSKHCKMQVVKSKERGHERRHHQYPRAVWLTATVRACVHLPNSAFKGTPSHGISLRKFRAGRPLTTALCPSAFCLQRIGRSCRSVLFNLAGAKSDSCQRLCVKHRPCPLPSTAKSLDKICYTTTAFIRVLRAGLCLRSPAPSLVSRHRQAPQPVLASRSPIRLRATSLA
jgi:hypothetical protein